MTETLKIEKEHIKAPVVEPGGTAIVLQRHERYQRDRNALDSGSIFEEDAETAKERSLEFFREVLSQDSAEAPTYIMFVSSDTQYNGMGRRSLETGQVAQEACAEALTEAGLEPAQRIINLNPAFKTRKSRAMARDGGDHDIRPFRKLREPDIFDAPGYVDFLRDKYGKEDGPGTGISKAAWAAHEADTEKEAREEFGAEGVHEITGRTRRSLEVFQEYARRFHKTNPEARLIIWATTHYDTISPLIKDSTGIPLTEYLPVDYGGGIVVNLPPDQEATVNIDKHVVNLKLGRTALKS